MVALACTLAVLPVCAQYKVVMPDGRVVYTDRPPADSTSRVTNVGPSTAAPSGTRAAPASGTSPLAAGLPTELRSVVQRYPVTLYTTPDCPPCDNARRLLQQRGIPYAERRVASEDDALALERLLGARTLPSLSIGPQPLRGFAEADWINFLETAGYPRESRLPKGWKAAEATPLVERVAAPTAAAEPLPPPVRAALPEPVTPAPGSLRF
jgi:glutaredoxin